MSEKSRVLKQLEDAVGLTEVLDHLIGSQAAHRRSLDGEILPWHGMKVTLSMIGEALRNGIKQLAAGDEISFSSPERQSLEPQQVLENRREVPNRRMSEGTHLDSERVPAHGVSSPSADQISGTGPQVDQLEGNFSPKKPAASAAVRQPQKGPLPGSLASRIQIAPTSFAAASGRGAPKPIDEVGRASSRVDTDEIPSFGAAHLAGASAAAASPYSAATQGRKPVGKVRELQDDFSEQEQEYSETEFQPAASRGASPKNPAPSPKSRAAG